MEYGCGAFLDFKNLQILGLHPLRNFIKLNYGSGTLEEDLGKREGVGPREGEFRIAGFR